MGGDWADLSGGRPEPPPERAVSPRDSEIPLPLQCEPRGCPGPLASCGDRETHRGGAPAGPRGFLARPGWSPCDDGLMSTTGQAWVPAGDRGPFLHQGRRRSDSRTDEKPACLRAERELTEAGALPAGRAGPSPCASRCQRRGLRGRNEPPATGPGTRRPSRSRAQLDGDGNSTDPKPRRVTTESVWTPSVRYFAFVLAPSFRKPRAPAPRPA